MNELQWVICEPCTEWYFNRISPVRPLCSKCYGYASLTTVLKPILGATQSPCNNISNNITLAYGHWTYNIIVSKL